MKPRHRNRRIILVGLFAGLFAIGAMLLFSALKQNTQFFYDPSEILAEDFSPKSTDIRIGGLVLEGSFEQSEGLVNRFRLADFVEGDDYVPDAKTSVSVTYTGTLPDLFREGQGIVVTGILVGEGDIVASEVLAKHDENYQPQK